MNRKRNWMAWVGFLLALAAPISYVLFFYRFPVTRDFPWVSFGMFALAAILLFAGIRRAFRQPESYRGKIFAPVLAVAAAALCGLFVQGLFVSARRLPTSSASPRIGGKGPGFTLSDQNGRKWTLEELVSAPLHGSTKANGALLIFYRGYW